MIIACPACATRYAVSDGAIGVNGRVVRCAKCRESWFQDGSNVPEALAYEAIPTPPAMAHSEAMPQPAASEPPGEPMPTPPPEATLPDYWDEPAQSRDLVRDFGDTPSSFAHEPPFRPRRNRTGVWLRVIIALALVAMAAATAIARFGVPDWLPISLPHSALAAAAPDLALKFPPDRQERRPLPNGGDFFNVSGTVVNQGRERRTVPTLLIMLRDSHNDIVYSLETASPKPILAPGESETINQAIIDAPASARTAEISWKER